LASDGINYDNRWLYLFRLDDAGRMVTRHAGGLAWTPLAPSSPVQERPKEFA